MRRAAVGLLLFGVLGVSWMALGQSGTELFEKALARERAEGNLDEAIKLYGSLDENLRFAEKHFGVQLAARERKLRVRGDRRSVKQAMDFFQDVDIAQRSACYPVHLLQGSAHVHGEPVGILPAIIQFRHENLLAVIAESVKIILDHRIQHELF